MDEDDRREGTARARDDERAVYVISIAAELAGMHPQTLRIYERKGLLRPARTAGNTRRYSERDIARLREIARLTQEGVGLAGVKLIVELEEQLEELRVAMEEMQAALERSRRAARATRESARESSEIVPLSSVRWLFPWDEDAR